ncbi:site-2 protease family protein [Lawsonia intracellularis]|uniref:Zn-dependent proteases n=1 Tax=Lawsonia intracellularis (strain PHE/MN1-00) TaxID=363253 RepID=Q1MSE8_LAWIP|nr:site-2 protease family protein [Lawsonia intracellularis]AGC49421.1 peptidase family M50 [Lawsonia intracellularis N343]KAA0204936.1 site-2 protease family protein [Lawsonia intracellularis]MBZ3893171.1 site-2 protease family protein [Lawsonia intracellularis]OMQ06082.1 site-2 protease family protein [Lawsonia intracellularis]RBN32515.1 site-2 protease family protein [Lawsonia intracellularis]
MFEFDITNAIKRIAVAFVPLVLGIILHEVAHGWVAQRRGDPTAAMLGRITLNPTHHIDPLGLMVFTITSLTSPFIFGWAKPVPINPRNFYDLRKDTMLVSFAGPAANFLLAFTFGLLLRIFLEFFPAYEWQQSSVWTYFFLMFSSGIIINFTLAWLNLLPIPPLDGSKILWAILPNELGYKYMLAERYGFVIFIALLLTGLLGYILYPLINLSLILCTLLFGLN